MTTISPYLNFPGNCEEVFNFYKSVFGGEYGAIQRYKEMPAEFASSGPEGEKILHMSLPIGQGSILMGSDRPERMGPISVGNNFTISIHPTSEDEATRLFNGLSAGGNVTMPLAKAFWGAYFGMFNDKFGISWMVNYDTNQQ